MERIGAEIDKRIVAEIDNRVTAEVDSRILAQLDRYAGAGTSAAGPDVSAGPNGA